MAIEQRLLTHVIAGASPEFLSSPLIIRAAPGSGTVFAPSRCREGGFVELRQRGKVQVAAMLTGGAPVNACCSACARSERVKGFVRHCASDRS